MPNPGRRFLQVDVNNHSMSNSSHSSVALQRQQRCFVCYNEFTPFKLTADKWESNMIKMFYSALNLPAPDDGGDDDDEDPIISLPFCPQCHSKISVMSSLHGQLQLIQSQFSSIRNDVVFTIVETNGKNCRKGPMDFIRQQIYEKWKPRYEEANSKAYFDQPIGLEAIANDSGLATKRNQDEFLYPNSEDTSLMEGFTNSLGLAVSPFGGVAETRFANSTPAKKFANNKRLIKDEPDGQAPSSKRPARSAAGAHFLQYNESSSMSKLREMESVAKSMGPPAMPKLIPMGMQGSRGKRISRNSDESSAMNADSSTILETGKPSKDFGNQDEPQSPAKPVKRVNANAFANRNLMKFGRMKPGPKKQVLAKMKFPPGRRGKPGRPPGWRRPFPRDHIDDQLDTSENTATEENSFNQGEESTLSTNNEETDNSVGGGSYCCQLCPKSYYNISRLRRHESLCHPTTKALQCALCPNGFSSILAFRRHMQNQHNQSMIGISTMTCAICRKVFVKQSAFDFHMTTHESVLHGAVTPRNAHKVSGHPTRKKPGPRPKMREISPPIVEDDDILPSVAKVEHEESNEQIQHSEPTGEMETEEEFNDSALQLQTKTPVQKKKKTFFTGTRKRKRRRGPKPEAIETTSEVPKKEPTVDRVIIPRKKFQNMAPVRKSLRRAESSSASAAVKADETGSASEDKAIEPETEESPAATATPTPANANIEPTLSKKVPAAKNTISESGANKEEGNGSTGVGKEERSVTQSSPQKGKKEKPLSRSNSKEPIGDVPLGPRGRVTCPLCNLEYPFIGLLIMHFKGHPSDETKCEDCGEEFQEGEKYRFHIVTEHKRQLHPCPSCDKEFGSSKHLAAHEISHKFEKWNLAPAQTTRSDSRPETSENLKGLNSPARQAQQSSDFSTKSKSVNDSEKVKEETAENSDQTNDVALTKGDDKDKKTMMNGPKSTPNANANNGSATVAAAKIEAESN